MKKRNEFYYKGFPWMNSDQLECYELLCDIHDGGNRLFGKIYPCGESGIYINSTCSHYMSTFDYSNLTRAVVLAHDRMIRFQIEPSRNGVLKLIAHKRHKRDGRMNERHPTIEDAIANIRDQYGYDKI
jgi:hypothetical protein